MSNPYAAKGPVRHSAEVRNPVDEFADRLVLLGASRSDVDDWLDEIDLAGAEFERVRRMTDDEVRFHLEAVSGPLAEPEPLTGDGAAVGLVDVPGDLLSRNVPEIVAWVGDDPERAEVVAALESLDERPRKTLIEPLREVVADGAPR